MMEPSAAFNAEPTLQYEEWKAVLRSLCGRYSAEGVEPNLFTGSVRPVHICGLEAVDLSCNAHRIERTCRDIRLDGTDHYGAIFQLAGRSTLVQNDRVTELKVGDVALVDATQPVTYIAGNSPGRWIGLQLPRQTLVSHLGLEPEAGSHRHSEALASRLLFRLIQDAANECDVSAALAGPYMQLAIYDLVGALFAATDRPSISTHSDKLFVRVCGIIKAHFADPDLSPAVVAAEAGISLRYLQKLFTLRGATCSHFIYSVRLDQATRLIRRRAAMKAEQPLSMIAYACGFRDYTHFARAFRQRFGHAPGVHGSHIQSAGTEPVRPHTHESAR
jgi:AraC family transcriptional regulator, positive regulator of tynA and feaB